MWLDSVVDLGAPTNVNELMPLQDERSCHIDWNLPLREDGMKLLWSRMFSDYRRQTSIVADEKKRNYRPKEDKLYNLRNLAAFWSQVEPFAKANMEREEYESFLHDVMTSPRRDNELLELTTTRPSNFAVSMLASQRSVAKMKVENRMKEASMGLEAERLKLRSANYTFFKRGLEQDWVKLQTVKEAFRLIGNAQHRKRVMWQNAEATKGTRAIEWMQLNLTMKHCHHMNFAAEVRAHAESIATSFNKKVGDLHILCLADLNVPFVAGKLPQLAQCVKEIHAFSPTASMCVLTFADNPPAHCARGLSDHEREVDDELWAVNQFTDTRWTIPHEGSDARSTKKSNCRRFVCGRCVMQHDQAKDNVWSASELVVSGRPMRQTTVRLPKQSQLALPESLNANRDLRLAERPRPGVEQVAAQKSLEYNQTLLTTALEGLEVANDAVLLVVNITGYVEDQGLAFLKWRVDGETIGGFNPKRARYLNFNLNQQNFEYNCGVVQCELMHYWKEGKISTPGNEHHAKPEPLTKEELAEIPGAAEALGDIKALNFEVLTVCGSNIEIASDHKRSWTSVDDDFAADFQRMEAQHEEKYKNMLSRAMSSSNSNKAESGAGADPEEEASGGQHGARRERVVMNSVEDLNKTYVVEYDGLSDIPGVNIHIVSDGNYMKVFLTNTKDTEVTIGRKAHLGGFGTGQHLDCKTELDSTKMVVPYKFDDDKVLVEFDNQSLDPETTGFSCMTFYQMMKKLKCAGCVIKNVSFLKVTRAAGSQAVTSDNFDIEQTTRNVYTCLDDGSIGIEGSAKKKSTDKLNSKSCFRLAIQAIEMSSDLAVC